MTGRDIGGFSDGTEVCVRERIIPFPSIIDYPSVIYIF